MTESQRAYLLLHIAIVLWGFTAVLGDLISLSAVILVWWRVGLTSTGMLTLKNVFQGLKKITRRDFIIFSLIGAVISMHWICFYGSVKLANASVALIAVSTTALFTSILEPLLMKHSLDRQNVIFGIAVIPGVVLIAGGLRGDMLAGLIVGLLAAVLAAMFAIYNKKYIKNASPQTITFIEMFGAWVFMSGLLIVLYFAGELKGFWPSHSDWIYLIVLVIACTIIPFIIHLKALDQLTAFASNLIINLEPVYGILLAFVILKEYQELNFSFYLGGLIILSTILLYPIFTKKKKRKASAIGI